MTAFTPSYDAPVASWNPRFSLVEIHMRWDQVQGGIDELHHFLPLPDLAMDFLDDYGCGCGYGYGYDRHVSVLRHRNPIRRKKIHLMIRRIVWVYGKCSRLCAVKVLERGG